MPAIELPDRSRHLFGREKDVCFLTQRASNRGLTAVVARPQMGKTWLLQETARRLSLITGASYLVGYAEAVSSTPDLLLRSIADLYQRWLEDAPLRQQAVAVWEQQKGSLLPNFATAMGKIIKEVPVIGKPLGGAINEALTGLIAANRTLREGVLQLPPLQYEQARDLMRLVSEVSGRPIALILDQWEKSSSPSSAIDPLYAFVHKAEEWPRCHMFLGLRNEPQAIQPIRDLIASHAGRAQLYELSEMDLSDPTEERRMLTFLNATVPVTTRVDTAAVIQKIAGYPGVIYRWTSSEQRTVMRSGEDLSRVAADAHNFRFRELEAQLGGLKDQRLRLVVRVALVPLVTNSEAWPILRPVVLDGIDEELLDELKAQNILEDVSPPNFGHAKKLEVALARLNREASSTIRSQGNVVARGLGKRVTKIDEATRIPSMALRDLLRTAHDQRFDPAPRALRGGRQFVWSKNPKQRGVTTGSFASPR